MRKFFFLSICFFAISLAVFAEPTNYTYNYDFWDEYVASPDAYRVSSYILGTSLGIDNFRDPQGLFIRENRVYVCDSGNNRIVLFEVNEKGEYILSAVVSSVVIDGVVSPLNYPMDIFECREGFIYIADTNNMRILKLDRDWNYIFSITRPDDESIDDFVEFQPLKLIVDFANRIFAQVRNVNKGLMEFDGRGEFVGYMGANKVAFNLIDYIWKFISTQEQRARMELFVPTEYNNLALDSDGFIYVTNAAVSATAATTAASTTSSTPTDQTDPVRRLNAMGQDILIRNGYSRPIGDIDYTDTAITGVVTGPSRFIDVVAFDNDSYACFDRARGRIFMYDFQGNLLYAFGGLGNREGCFLMPVALDRMGTSLYALDSRTGAVTRFDLTSYGVKINEALDEYKAGRYESSAALWEEVLKMNGNYDLAYIGIGRAALRQGEYQKAMKYYKLKHYRQGYSRAFQLYRKEWVEENLWKILLALGILIIVPLVVKYSIKIVREIREA
uniref:NHL repeat protein n=1 Tax=uncultured bacterium contig00066 TaxID=1181548 RepID=A0A806JYY5_9BACT|nr:NHL repeat protein [uncultured bacterium contig00066]